MEQLRWFEAAAVVLAAALALWSPRRAVRWCRAGSRRLGGLARRRVWAVALVGAAAFATSAALSWVRWPVPRVQDEFSYLLAADTFAAGRLTNPTPPLAEHFESKHILVRPTYQSKYPPAQGLFLALGQVLAGQPLAGVWLSWALACAALTWMLQGWVPPRWALLGGLLAAAHLGGMDEWLRGRYLYWSQSYWGGAVALLGGSLLFGGLRRIRLRPTLGASAALGVGLVVLALSRPFEGLVASLPAMALVSVWAFRVGRQVPAARPPPERAKSSPPPPAQKGVRRGSDAPPAREIRRPGVWAARALLPAGAVLVLGLSFLGYYQYRVTGSPWRMPHRVHEESSGTTPHFVLSWLRSDPSEAGAHEDRGSGGEVREDRRRRWLSYEYPRRYRWLWSFYLGPALTLPFLAGLWAARRRRWTLFAAGTLVLVAAANAATVAGFPHYYAPAAPLILFLSVQGLRRLGAWRRRGRAGGRLLSGGLVAAALATFVAGAGVHVHYATGGSHPKIWSQYRAEIASRLETMDGRHLVLVRSPPPSPDRNDEWVYNRADIEGAKVIWARELGPEADARLLRHFRDRVLWSLRVDTRHMRFGPYGTLGDP